jgi:hypothetical protein
MLSRFFNQHHPFLSLNIIVPVTMLLFVIGCGSKTVDVATSHDHPASPDAPQAAFEEPVDSLTEEMTHAENSTDMAETHANHTAMALPPDGAVALTTMLNAYFAIGNQLASDTMDDVNTNASTIIEAFHTLEDEVSDELWNAHANHTEAIHDFAHELADLSDIKAGRIAYGSLSDAFNHFVAAVGVPASYQEPVYSYVCGMAADVPQGGIWLQTGLDVRNPYFGSAMLQCSSERTQLPAASAKMSEHEHMMKEEGEHEHHHNPEHDEAHEHGADKDEKHEHEQADSDKDEKHEHKHERK